MNRPIDELSDITPHFGGVNVTNGNVRVEKSGSGVDWLGPLGGGMSVQSNTGNNGYSVLGTGTGFVMGAKADNTLAEPQAVSSNSVVFQFRAYAYDGAGYRQIAAVNFVTDGTQTESNRGASIRFSTCLNGSTSLNEKMRLSGMGNLLVGVTSDPSAAGPGNLRVGGVICTGAPSGGTAGEWKLGTYDGTVPTPSGRVRIEIGGAAYYVPAELISP